MTDISVVVTSYNHSAYIMQCFVSIAEQITSKEVEIVWCDDASTDDTIAMGELALKDCRFLVKRIHYSNNRRSRRIPTLLDKIEQCRGRYIFWIEGDDFWLDKRKMDLQLNALEENPEINICFTPAHVFSGMSPEPKYVLAGHGSESKIFSLDTVITGDGGFMPTVSLCFRREVFENAPKWLYGYLPVGDYPMQVVGASPMGALYLPQITCGYRENVSNSWTSSVFGKPAQRIIFELEFLELILIMAKYFSVRSSAFEGIFINHYNSLLQLAIEQDNHSILQKAKIILEDFKISIRNEF